MELKQSDTINRYDKEMKSQEELKHLCIGNMIKVLQISRSGRR